jgi:FixJ family two-component response regulator
MSNNIYLSPNRTDNSIRDIYAVITDRYTLYMLECLSSADCNAGTLRDKTRNLLSHRQYYSRMSNLLRMDLVIRHGLSYRITSFGKIFLQLQLWSQQAFNSYWKLKMIDSLENLSEKEHESFIDGVITNSQIRSMLRSTITKVHEPSSYKEYSVTLSSEKELVGRHYNMMLVDDDRDILITLRAMLGPYDINVKTFDSSYDALKDFLNNEPNSYDMVILDIKMPGLNGLQLYQRIRAIDSRIKILFLSALSLREELASMLPDVPLYNVIGKPVSNNDFIKVVTKELRELPDRISDLQISRKQLLPTAEMISDNINK